MARRFFHPFSAQLAIQRTIPLVLTANLAPVAAPAFLAANPTLFCHETRCGDRTAACLNSRTATLFNYCNSPASRNDRSRFSVTSTCLSVLTLCGRQLIPIASTGWHAQYTVVQIQSAKRGDARPPTSVLPHFALPHSRSRQTRNPGPWPRTRVVKDDHDA